MQAGSFYKSLPEEQKKDLTEAVAEDIFFLDEELQREVIKLLNEASEELGAAVKKRNDFTT